MFKQYPEYETFLASAQLVFVMFGMGATLTIRDFLGLTERPNSILVYLIAYLIVIPLWAVALGRMANIEAGIALGLVLMAVVPGGALTNVLTLLAKGNVALSIAMTASATVGSIVTVPFLFRLLASEVASRNIEVPVAKTLLEVFFFLLLPLAIGMVVGATMPRRRDLISKWSVRIGLCILSAVIVGSIGNGRLKLAAYGWQVPCYIILFCIVAQQIAVIPFHILKLPSADRVAVGIEVTVRNAPLALLLNVGLFPHLGKGTDAIADGMLFVIFFYGFMSLFAAIPLILTHRRIVRRQAQHEPEIGRAAAL